MGALRCFVAVSCLVAVGCGSGDDGPVCSGIVPGDFIVVLQKHVDAYGTSARLTAQCGGEVGDVWTSALNGFQLRCDPHFEWKISPGPYPSSLCMDILPCMLSNTGIDYIEPDKWSCTDRCPCGGPPTVSATADP